MADGVGGQARHHLLWLAVFLLPTQHPLPRLLEAELLLVVVNPCMWFSQPTLPSVPQSL